MKNPVNKVMMVLVLAAAAMLTTQAWALMPVSYSYDPFDVPFSGYPDSGGSELTDGVIGSSSYSDTAWVGFYQSEMPFPVGATFDFGAIQQFTGISIWGLNNPGSGILPLSTFTVTYSNDGLSFGGAQTFPTTGAEQAGNPLVREFARGLSGSGRFVNVSMNVTGAGSFLFISELDFVGVPEPTTVSLLGLGAWLVCRRKHRRA